MAGTRSSARLSGASSSPNAKDEKSQAGTKRKADANPSSQGSGKKGRPAKKQQKTLEETMPDTDESKEENKPNDVETKDEDKPNDIGMQEAADVGEGTDKKAGEQEDGEAFEAAVKEAEAEGQTIGNGDTAADASNGTGEHDLQANGDNKAEEEAKSANTEKKETVPAITEKKETEPELGATKGGTVQKSEERANEMPSNILEKGIIYFFTRPRVNMEDPEGASDLQRSYFVLRPMAKHAKLTDGALEDSENNRLFALPKKVFPKSHSDRFMAFTDRVNTTIKDLKENYFPGSSYDTATTGTRVQPGVIPAGEGVYAITQVERSTHLVYMLTIPNTPGEVQEELGIKEKGSFLISVKNPERGGPANTNLDKSPEFPKEILEEFRGLAWVAVKPKYLNYENVQILLIGDDDISKGLDQSKKDEKNGDKETPLQEIEKLEHEDELRVEHLNGDDSVFDDLGISHKDYPQVPTTW